MTRTKAYVPTKWVQIQTNSRVSDFNLQRLQVCTKRCTGPKNSRMPTIISCEPIQHSLADALLLFSRFSNAAAWFGGNVSMKMSEVMLQSSHPLTCTMAIDTPLNVMDKFCYISILSSDKDISTHTAKASQFYRLSRRLWDNHSVQLDTNVVA